MPVFVLRAPLSMLASFSLVLACAADDADDDAADTHAESSDAGSADGSESSSGGVQTAAVSGDTFVFGPSTMLPTGSVTIRELPEASTATDADGHFEFEGLPTGVAATFVFEAEGYPLISTKTFTLPEAGGLLERVTFQVPDDATYGLLASLVDIVPDPDACQIATTVTRVGKSVYDPGAHGEAGATVTIDPPVPVEHGPIYFDASVIPDLDLTETSEDGGVLFVNVPTGTYTLTAIKAGVEFETVEIACEAGVLVNASPPFGLQAL
jgi:hypothetical protein